MTSHRIQWGQAWAYVTPEAWSSGSTQAAVIQGLVAKANAHAKARGLVLLEGSSPNVQSQRQILPVDGEPDPRKGMPYQDGDIIPPGWHVLWGVLVNVTAYDPKEQA